MTDNIQTLYEVAGVKEKRGVELTIDPTSETPKFNEHYVCYGYPPFTAEKQLELIKWLAQSRPIHISVICGDWSVEGMTRLDKKSTSFEQALAFLVLKIWEYLTDDQKQEIKRILNNDR